MDLNSAAQMSSTKLLPNEHIAKHNQGLDRAVQNFERRYQDLVKEDYDPEKHRRYPAKWWERVSKVSDSESEDASDIDGSQSVESDRVGSANSSKNKTKSGSSATSTSAVAPGSADTAPLKTPALKSSSNGQAMVDSIDTTEASLNASLDTEPSKSALEVAQTSKRPGSVLNFEAPHAPVMNDRFYATDYPSVTAERQEEDTGR